MTEPESPPLSFEQALTRLEEVVRDLEDGQLPLEDALAKYEAGIGLLKHCYEKLNAAEEKISLLTGVDADGNPVLETFEHAASVTLDSPQGKRRRRPVT
jgi:exodeoxyribonuclease VII small subunit